MIEIHLIIMGFSLVFLLLSWGYERKANKAFFEATKLLNAAEQHLAKARRINQETKNVNSRI